MRTTFESLSAGGGFGVEDGGETGGEERAVSTRQRLSCTGLGPMPMPIQAQNDGSGCSDRGEPTNESLPNGSAPIGSRRRRDGGATSVFVAFDSAGKNRTGPRSAKRARNSGSDRWSTDAQQEHGTRDRERQRAETQAGTISAVAADVRWSDGGELVPLCTASLLPCVPSTWRLMGPPLIASCQEACCAAASPTR